MTMIRAANLAVRFLLELCALAALGYWGFVTGNGASMKALPTARCAVASCAEWSHVLSGRHRLIWSLCARLAPVNTLDSYCGGEALQSALGQGHKREGDPPVALSFVSVALSSAAVAAAAGMPARPAQDALGAPTS
ncbi:MAG: hypothetical protein DCC57_19460 [Chloroflexi bacterium]|nr:MAG: hypothetical protein DCC57_19460 [Chloroflexota bacterium]